ncbi:MAG: GntR family transcriptional regulator [Clostridium sp.]|uniref:GntR family transcriptional regulator n=1 Tax=Clostridium sp. TaxID=1506 RepID=UPI002FC867F1
MNLVLDFESEVPIYLQLRNEIVKAIALNQLEEGYSLPSVRSLADDIGINMHTVNKAYNILKSEGYITLDRRHGAFISKKAVSEDDNTRLNLEFEGIIISCLAKGMDKEEIEKMVQSIYLKLKGEI